MSVYSLLLIVLVLAAVVVVIVVASRSSSRRRGESSSTQEQAQIESQAAAMRQWQAAYELANPGKPVPPPPMAAAPNLASRTNTLAILSLVFGILGGYLAIIFGHIALSQIKRTGEGGRGLAIAGLILGYLWLATTITFVIIAFHTAEVNS